MPDILVPHPVHGVKRHLPTGIDPVNPEDIGAINSPRIRFIDETISATTTYTPTRTGMRFIPLFIRAVATNPAGAATYEVRHRLLDENGGELFTHSTTVGAGNSVFIHGNWSSDLSGLANLYFWQTPEAAANFLTELTAIDNNKGLGSIEFAELQNGNNGSTTVEMALWEV